MCKRAEHTDESSNVSSGSGTEDDEPGRAAADAYSGGAARSDTIDSGQSLHSSSNLH